MGDTIHKIDYYHTTIPDRPGEGLRVLMGLKEAEVNLLACCGFPIGEGKVQLDLVPEYDESFRKAAARMDLPLSEKKHAFLIQGSDRAGAASDTFAKLAARGINVRAAQAISTGQGRWGMILWVDPADHEKASEALGF